MALRNVVMLGDDLLRKKSKTVVSFDDDLHCLLDDMAQTMKKNDGMGIAAPQVGCLKRAVIIECNNIFLELINPEIISQSGEDIETEGCLSVSKIHGKVKRPMVVTVHAQDRYGFDFTITGEKWLARVLCHEIDHLNGIVFVDKMIPGSEDEGEEA